MKDVSSLSFDKVEELRRLEIVDFINELGKLKYSVSMTNGFVENLNSVLEHVCIELGVKK